jgi:hypothetical protein
LIDGIKIVFNGIEYGAKHAEGHLKEAREGDAMVSG